MSANNEIGREQHPHEITDVDVSSVAEYLCTEDQARSMGEAMLLNPAEGPDDADDDDLWRLGRC